MTIHHTSAHDTGDRRWPEVNRDHPCPVCDRTDRCKVSPDGGRVLCWKVESNRPIKGGEGWLHDSPNAAPPPVRRSTRQPRDFPATATRCAARMTPAARDRLAAELRLPAGSLAYLPVGVHSEGTPFTFPECDAGGRVIGVVCRAADGSKKSMPGGKRGLSVPAGWRDRTGSLYVVEGPTDTLAMTHAGLACVGRPSNTGGADLLAALLADWPADRHIVVVGENDEKPDGSWPGKDGAVRLAQHLARTLRRPVAWSLPPAGVKDARAWLTAPERGDTPWAERGAEFGVLLTGRREFVPPPSPGPRSIRVDHEVGRMNDEASAALGRAEDVYHRNARLVHVIEQDADSPECEPVRQWKGAVRIRDLPAPLLLDRLSRVVRWYKEKKGKEETVEVPVQPPVSVVNGVLAAGEWPSVRRLAGVVTHPVLLRDGTILASPGYHPGTGLLVRPAPGLEVTVPDAPNRADVRAAVQTLLDVVCDFPFESSEHRAAWVAGLLTPLAWHAFDGPAPLFLVDANTRGAGKTLLVDVIGQVVTGGRLPVMVYTPDEDELRKRITTLAVEGTGMVTLDNLTGSVGNGTLDAALTGAVWRDRLLGVNESFEGPLSVVWYGTGNNCQLAADTGRRTCHIRLETADERPELKTAFRHPDLRRHVKEHRNELLSAALTILRAWVLAGMPDQGLPPWGSFERWSDFVRGCVVWAGLADPGETRRVLLETADRDAVAVGAFAKALARIDPDRRGLYASEIIARMTGDPELRAAVEDLTAGRADANALGRRMKSFRRRVFNGLFLDHTSKTGHGRRWAAFPASEFNRRPVTPAPAEHAEPESAECLFDSRGGVRGAGGAFFLNQQLPD